MSLLERQLQMLDAAGAARVTVVLGHQAGQVKQSLATMASSVPGMELSTQLNPDYRNGSVLSCLAAATPLTSGDETWLMDADAFCDAHMLQRLLDSRQPNGLLVDAAGPPDDEAVKLAARVGQPVGFGKHLGADVVGDVVGETVGFFRLAPAMAPELADLCSQSERAGDIDAPHEQALRELMLTHPRVFGYTGVSGLPWIEIDFPEDLLRARREELPRLHQLKLAP